MANTNHPYLPKSEQLYSKPPLDKVQMQYLWKVMDDLNNGLISVNEAVEILNSNPAGIAGVAKGDLIVFDGISWGILTVGADGAALVGDSTAAQGLSYQVVTTAPAGADTQIQFNNAGAFGADGSFTTTPAKITISKDRSGTDGALHIIKGDAAKQYIILEEDAAAPDEVYLGFKAQNGDVVAIGMEAVGGVPDKIIFTDPSAAILAWIDVVSGDLGVTNLSGVGSRLVTADATGVLGTTAMVTQYTDADAVAAIAASTYGKKIYTIGTITHNPADATTYYWGGPAWNPVSGAIQDRRKTYLYEAATITDCYIEMLGTSGGATTENISIYIQVNGVTDHLVQTTGFPVGSFVCSFSNTALNIVLGATDWFVFKIVCPTWVVNPANVYYSGKLLYTV